MEYDEILKSMVDAAPSKVTSCATSLSQIDSEINSLTEQANAIYYGMMTPIADYVDWYLNHKWDTTSGDYTVTFGPTYNQNAPTGTLTDWVVTDSTTGDIVYQYGGIGWDSDPAIIADVADWNWSLDYLWKELGFDGTYGIYDKIAKLQLAKGVIQSDMNKYATSIIKISPFAST
jgi:hypothetical protein